MRRLIAGRLKAGDVVFTAHQSLRSKCIRMATAGQASHVMICVQHCSIMEATHNGVVGCNVTRRCFADNENVWVYRLRQAPDIEALQLVIDTIRAAAGTRYSVREAMRVVGGLSKPRTRQQFCSRLIARAYANAGIKLVADADYCSPEALRRSSLLEEVTDVLEHVTEQPLQDISRTIDLSYLVTRSEKYVLESVRRLDNTVETFSDVIRLSQNAPHLDKTITQIIAGSEYDKVWRYDASLNEWCYSLACMEEASHHENIDALRTYCIETVKEAWTGGLRYPTSLSSYHQLYRQQPSATLNLMIGLYDNLSYADRSRRDTAKEWLLKYFPDDAQAYYQVITPHTALWFNVMDRVEPFISMCAQDYIEKHKTVAVCTTCGAAPAGDFQFAKGGHVLWGVPSLRLCLDCIHVQQKQKAILVPL